MQKLKGEISEKKQQIRVLEQRMLGSFESSPHSVSNFELSQALSKMATQLNERTFELEVRFPHMITSLSNIISKTVFLHVMPTEDHVR